MHGQARFSRPLFFRRPIASRSLAPAIALLAGLFSATGHAAFDTRISGLLVGGWRGCRRLSLT